MRHSGKSPSGNAKDGPTTSPCLNSLAVKGKKKAEWFAALFTFNIYACAFSCNDLLCWGESLLLYNHRDFKESAFVFVFSLLLKNNPDVNTELKIFLYQLCCSSHMVKWHKIPFWYISQTFELICITFDVEIHGYLAVVPNTQHKGPYCYH